MTHNRDSFELGRRAEDLLVSLAQREGKIKKLEWEK